MSSLQETGVMAEPTHIPVLVNEVLRYLVERPEQQVASSRGAGSDAPTQHTGRLPEEQLLIDGTVGQGGHAEQLLAALPGCRLLGFDRDPVNLSIAKKRLERFSDGATLVHDSYANASHHAYVHGFTQVDGVLLDLGFSSAHVDEPERGFSFMQEGPLDMRYDRDGEVTAETIINSWNVDDLAHIFRVYGEEPAAQVIAKAIYAARKTERITTTLQLAELVASVIRRRGKIHPATRVFQALRIAVNDELGELERALPVFVELLRPGGRLAIISFHSLEDRMIKRFILSQEGNTLQSLTKHVITPSEEEIRSNPRSRSAKLRVAERL
ncbi:16S rRNA (cytosine(1402)-N(4))-methyltransferase [Candidatus Uhrbacteria bacterium RIFOXYB12_FULL_58_10]|nr:MAG: 16S rRNA (cytosine(1402)-N(4))-methyltransferase [Candidatus Uhrbacteria bacterium RIFOXYB12_FULL_58_10]